MLDSSYTTPAQADSMIFMYVILIICPGFPLSRGRRFKLIGRCPSRPAQDATIAAALARPRGKQKKIKTKWLKKQLFISRTAMVTAGHRESIGLDRRNRHVSG
jgi:hypothetical protein